MGTFRSINPVGNVPFHRPRYDCGGNDFLLPRGGSYCGDFTKLKLRSVPSTPLEAFRFIDAVAALVEMIILYPEAAAFAFRKHPPLPKGRGPPSINQKASLA